MGAGTVMAFDFGTRRIGVAVGETEVQLAHPLPGIVGEIAQRRFAAIEALILEWQPAHLVVGLPLATDGAAHPMTARAQRFARQLNGRFGLPVHLVDERYTSVDAQATLTQQGVYGKAARDQLDSAAAQLILEQWFLQEPQA